MHHRFQELKEKNLIERKRIISLLNENQEADIISVSAGGGYGKTQAVISFLDQTDAKVFRYSFTKLDNNLNYFMKNFYKMVIETEPALDQRVNIDEALIKSFTLKYVNNNLSNTFWVFDDCYLIHEPAVMDFMRSFIQNIVPDNKVFLISRTEKFLESLNMDVNLFILKITEEQLAFEEGEIERYFNNHGMDASYQTIKKVRHQTEGWPIAVQLIVFAIKDGTAPETKGEIAEHELMYNMIDNYFFRNYSKEDQFIVLQLSILDIIPLEYVQENIGTEKFSELASNMLISCDSDTGDYQLHPLYKDFLNDKFKNLSKAVQSRAYRFAGDWFSNKNKHLNALIFYRHLDDWDLLWETLKKVFPLVYAVHNTDMVLDALKHFPAEYVKGHPLIRYYTASVNYALGKFKTAKRIISALMEDFEHDGTAVNNPSLYGEVILYYALMCLRLGESQFIYYMKRASVLLPNGSTLITGKVMLLKNSMPLLLNSMTPGYLDNLLELINEAVLVMNDLLHGISAGLNFISRSLASYYRADMAGTEENALRALKAGKERGNTDVVGQAYFLLIKSALYKADLRSILTCLNACREYIHENNEDSRFILLDIIEGFFYILMHDERRIPSWITADDAERSGFLANRWGINLMIRAKYLLNHDRYYELASYTRHMQKIYQNASRYEGVIYARVYRALAYYYVNKKDEAVYEVEKVWEMSQANQVCIPFIEQGNYTRTLFRYINNENKCNIPKPWVEKILTKSTTLAKKVNIVKKEYDRLYAAKEEDNLLSKKDREILAKLSIGFSREEISDYFGISENTVKSKLQNIYNKLGAANGIQAIKIALEKGLIL